MTNCNLCQSELRINESGMAVYCEVCDRNHKKKVLGGLLDAIKEKKIRPDTVENLEKFRIWAKAKEIENNIDEATVLYHCIKCERPTNKYGYCLWCEDMLRDTL